MGFLAMSTNNETPHYTVLLLRSPLYVVIFTFPLCFRASAIHVFPKNWVTEFHTH